jgi:hypothetical protein
MNDVCGNGVQVLQSESVDDLVEQRVGDRSNAPLAPARKRRLSAKRQQEWESYRNYWQGLLAEWEARNLTQREFCQQHNVKIGTFAKWRKKFREELAASGKAPPESQRQRRRTRPAAAGHDQNHDTTKPTPSPFVPLVVSDAAFL